MSTRKALVVGIDEYSQNPLQGCVRDANRISTLLARHVNDARNFDVKLLSSDGGSLLDERCIRNNLDELLRERDDIALFHFSGHGNRQDNRSYLVAQDGSTLRLNDLLEQVNQCPVRQVAVMLDCCFSGGLGATSFLGDDYSILREGVALLVASRATQPSQETAEGGIFSTLIADGLDGGATDVLGHVTIAGLYAYMDEALGAWDQRPLLKASLSHLARLRECEPHVPLATLRRLIEFFPTPDHILPLDPSYEPDERYTPKNPKHEEIFNRLQECNRARLVDPIDTQHMFYAAVDSKACRLTPLGQRYWRMARDGRI